MAAKEYTPTVATVGVYRNRNRNRNRNIRNGKWNIINVSSGKHLSYVEQLKKDHGDKRFCVHISQAKKNKNRSQTGIPELIKITGNVRAADSSAVNAELESCSEKKEEGGLYIILAYLLVLTHEVPVLPSYRNKSIDLHSKSTDCFLYQGDTGT